MCLEVCEQNKIHQRVVIVYFFDLGTYGTVYLGILRLLAEFFFDYFESKQAKTALLELSHFALCI